MASIDTYVTKTGSTMYRVRVQRKGHKTQTATFPTLRDARKWATMIEGQIIEGRHFSVKSTHTLAELLDRYCRDILPRKPLESRRSQMPVMNYWLKRLGHMLLDDIQSSDIITCRDEIARRIVHGKKPIAPATVIKYLNHLSHAFTIAVKEYQWIESNPCARVSRPSKPPGRIRYLSDEGRHRLLQECQRSMNPYLYGLVTLALYTGLRRGSLFALTTQNTDVVTGVITLPTSKSGRAITLPLIGEALDIARELATTSKDGYLFPRGEGDPWCHYKTAWLKALKRAKITGATFHSLRHCTGSYLVQARIPIYVVSQVLAHTKVTTTQIYSHLDVRNLKDALTTLAQRLSQ